MAVLVCGGAGYIGSHTARLLCEKAEDVIVFDSLEKGHIKAVRGAVFVKGDIRDRSALLDVFKKHDIDAVINFAAYIEAGESVKDPARYYENNVGGCISLLNVMKEAGVRNLVFSSTAAVYGNPEVIPVTEDSRLCPVNPYGETKLAVEKMFGWAERAYGIRHVMLRYFNAAGAHPDGSMGEDHAPETHLVPIVLQNALGQRNGLRIFGTDYDTTDGTCVRDYVHVCDLAQAHWLALRKLRIEAKSGVYNLGNGRGFSNREIVAAACEVTGINIPYEDAPRREGDPAVLVASSEKAGRELGWKPDHIDVKEIIATAWKWHVAHPAGYADR